MKKIFLFFTLAMAACAINAQNNGSCPSWLELRIPKDIGNANHLEIELWLHNSSQNLNGFVVTLSLDERAQWLIVDEENNKYFTATGYGKNILARWEGVTDEEREADLLQRCDIRSALRSNGDLYILEILSTTDCKFFPTTSEDSYGNEYNTGIPVGRFAIDVSNFDDGWNWYSGLSAPGDDVQKYSFSYTGGVEGTRAWASEGFSYDIYKWGNYASFHYFPENYDAIEEIENAKNVASVKYYNLAGVESAEPFSGVNIEVTTYSDGSTTTKKVLK